jgi:hypothetical protein
MEILATVCSAAGHKNDYYTVGAPYFKTVQSGNLKWLVKDYKIPNPKYYENWSINKFLKCNQSFD